LNDTTTFQQAKNQCEIAKYWKSLLFRPSKILKKKIPSTRIMDDISIRVHAHVLCIFLLLLNYYVFTSMTNTSMTNTIQVFGKCYHEGLVFGN